MAINQTPKGEALTNLILETFRLNGELLQAGNKLTKPHNLTSARWQVMGAVGSEKNLITVAQIARRMGLVRQGVQRIVNDLEEDGLVSLEENLDHKRAKLVRLTEAGEKALTRVQADQSAWVNALSEGLNKAEINKTIKMLQAIRKRLLIAEAS